VPIINSWTKNLINKLNSTKDKQINSRFPDDNKHRIWYKKLEIKNSNKKVHVHVYFNQSIYIESKNLLFEQIATVKKLLDDGKEVGIDEDFINQFLIITKVKESKIQVIVEPNMDAIDQELSFAGWSILVSNQIDNTQKVYDIYYNRDMVETSFFKYHRAMNFDILEEHNNIRMNNTLFIIFLCLEIDRYVTANT
jgi:hypothetical protein